LDASSQMHLWRAGTNQPLQRRKKQPRWGESPYLSHTADHLIPLWDPPGQLQLIGVLAHGRLWGHLLPTAPRFLLVWWCYGESMPAPTASRNIIWGRFPHRRSFQNHALTCCDHALTVGPSVQLKDTEFGEPMQFDSSSAARINHHRSPKITVRQQQQQLTMPVSK